MRDIRQAAAKQPRPVKVLQYGEGNFMRAFADWMIDIANEKGVFDGAVMVAKPIEYGSLEAFHFQDCIYTVLLRGKAEGETVSQARVITSVAGAVDCYAQYEQYATAAENPDLRFVISNTTEAGIVYDETDLLSLKPPKSYPGKLTKLLYERWQAFDGNPEKGLIILPVELIERNGQKLKECCERLAKKWGLPETFGEWLSECNVFCQTLVDRIVTGYPKEEAGALAAELSYDDRLLVTGEPFALWVIESDRPELVRREFPLDKAGLPVIFTNDLQPYRERKVRLLNGSHTSTVMPAFLAGLDTVGELMADTDFNKLLRHNIYAELAPCVPLPADEVNAFAASVLERFENPFIRHELLSIALNSVSKWRARILPSLKETIAKTGAPPPALAFSLAALAAFYSGDFDEAGKLTALRGEDRYEIRDNAAVLAFFAENRHLPAAGFTAAFLRREDFWGEDLSALPGLASAVENDLRVIRDSGMRGAVQALLCGVTV